MFTVAVDIGGTFTDVFVLDEETGHTFISKTATTPDDLLVGVMTGLDEVAAQMGLNVEKLLNATERFIHATTQSSNAIFAFTGARTAVLTTRGFGDTLTIMRATGRVAGLSVMERHHYRKTDKPRLLVDERDIFEVSERVDSKGRVVVPLDEEAVHQIVRLVHERGYEALAVAFLFSQKNPGHEKRVGTIVSEEAPELFLSLSSAFAPEIGEYERSATALFNAYVGRIIERYLERLERTLIDSGLRRKLLIVQSNGGLVTPEQTIPVFTIESGPAVGGVGAANLARALGQRDVIATDIGGTTSKVAVIKDGKWNYKNEAVINQYQLRMPMVDVTSIGAGGGSIAWVDGRRLRVGPHSAAAYPGPACYGFGGDEPTITDTDLLLGYLDPERFLGGRMILDPELAAEVVQSRVASLLFDGDLIAAAAGIRQIIDAQVADLIRKATLERGHDPRSFVIMAYGGCAPAHVASYGLELNIREMIIPFQATAFSAYGAALADVRFSLRISDPLVLPAVAKKVNVHFDTMEERGHALLDDAGVPPEKRVIERWLEARYLRQVHTIRVPVPRELNVSTLSEVSRRFRDEYERLYGAGSALPDADIELVTYCIDAVGMIERSTGEKSNAIGEVRPRTHRPTYCPFRREMVTTPIFDASSLFMGSKVNGPAVIQHPGTTIIVHRGQVAEIDEYRHTHILERD